MDTIYLDSAATTRPWKEVVDVVSDTMLNHYGNPSSTHKSGQEARRIVEGVRKQISKDINCDPDEIIFTSGACEANTLVYNIRSDVPYFITSSRLEHKSLENLNKEYASFIRNDNIGNIDLEDLEQKLLHDGYVKAHSIVSIQAANSEIGTIQDLKAISDIVHKYNGILHTDATQLYPERRIDVKELGVDLMSVSAQKFHGPKGVGFLYVRKGIELKPIIYGSQENGLRGGTYNTPLIAGMGEALRITRNFENLYSNTYIKECRDKILEKLLMIPGIELNGPMPDKNRLVNNISIKIKGCNANDLVTMCSMYGIEISAGSACSSGENIPSSTLKAIGLTDEEALSTVRLTLDEELSDTTIDYVVNTMSCIIKQLRTQN